MKSNSGGARGALARGGLSLRGMQNSVVPGHLKCVERRRRKVDHGEFFSERLFVQLPVGLRYRDWGPKDWGSPWTVDTDRSPGVSMATGGHGAAARAARPVRVKSVRVIMVKIGLSVGIWYRVSERGWLE